MELAQLVHVLGPQLGAAVGQQLGAHPQPRGRIPVPSAPGPQLGEYGDELEAFWSSKIGSDNRGG